MIKAIRKWFLGVERAETCVAYVFRTDDKTYYVDLIRSQPQLINKETGELIAVFTSKQRFVDFINIFQWETKE